MEQQARDHIERLLAQAFGHRASEAILKRAAEHINMWAEHRSWGPNLRELYSGKDHILSKYIKADREKLELLNRAFDAQGHNQQLTADEARTVVDHWRLVDSEARKIAQEDTELYYRLTAIGRIELENAVRRFDRTQNATFGAFVKKRIHGCMVNYLERVRYR